MSLAKDQLEILSNHYSKIFDVWEVNAELYECLEMRGNDSFYVFRTFYYCNNTLK